MEYLLYYFVKKPFSLFYFDSKQREIEIKASPLKKREDFFFYIEEIFKKKQISFFLSWLINFPDTFYLVVNKPIFFQDDRTFDFT